MDLRINRLIAKKTQYDVHAETGISQSRISLAERGILKLKEEELSKLQVYYETLKKQKRGKKRY